MLLNFVGTSANTVTGASQANIGTALTLGAKTKVDGEFLLNSNAAGSMIGGAGTSTMGTQRFNFVSARTGGNVTILLTGNAFGNPLLQLVVPEGDISTSEDYVLIGLVGPGGCHLIVRRASDGTQVGTTQTAAGVTVSANDVANGFVRLGDRSGVTGPSSGSMDGFAIYDQAPPDNVNAPSAGDSGILWGVLDNSGNIVAGAEALATFSGASWGAGGTWDPSGSTTTYDDSISETITFSDSISSEGEFEDTLSETITLGDSIASEGELEDVLEESIEFIESLANEVDWEWDPFEVGFSDSLADEIVPAGGPATVVDDSISESVAFSDSRAEQGEFEDSILEGVGFATTLFGSQEAPPSQGGRRGGYRFLSRFNRH